MSASSQPPGRDTGAPPDPSGDQTFDDDAVASTTPLPSDRSGGDGPDAQPAGLGGRVATVVSWIGLVLLALVAVAAVAMTIGVLLDAFGTGIDRAGLVWMGIAAVTAVAALGGLVVVVRIARRGHAAWAAALGLAAIGVTRALAIATIPTPLTTDWVDYHNHAVILASGGGFASARPPGWPFVLSLLYRVAGPNPLAGEISALVCAVGVGILIYLIARRWHGDVAAAAGLFLWAISPGPAAFSAVLASEHLHDLLFVAAFGLALLALERRWIAWLGVGVLLGLSQYVRPIGLVIVPAFALLPFLAGVPRRRAAAAAISIVVAFGLVLVPSIVSQYQRYGRVTLSTSNFDGWNLLVGLNVTSGGQYSRDDAGLVNARPTTVEFRDRSYRLAIERLTQHPSAVLTLAVPKFQTMWGDSTYGATWTLGGNRPGHPRAAATLALLSQAGYTAIAVLAAASLWIRRHSRDPVGLLAVLCLEAVALSATVLEVQSRYHAFFEPILCLLAGAAVAWLAERISRSTATAVGAVPTYGVASADLVSGRSEDSGQRSNGVRRSKRAAATVEGAV
jgi:hypothetical protein